MAESIENQLNGGEPTFNTSSMQGGGMGGGGKGGPDFGGEKPDMPSRTEQSETSETAEAQAMNLTAEADRTEHPPDFGGGEKTPPGMPGQDNKSVSLSDCLPMIAVCGGVFVVGAVVLILFKRKKDLKPPKEHKTE